MYNIRGTGENCTVKKHKKRKLKSEKTWKDKQNDKLRASKKKKREQKVNFEQDTSSSKRARRARSQTKRVLSPNDSQFDSIVNWSFVSTARELGHSQWRHVTFADQTSYMNKDLCHKWVIASAVRETESRIHVLMRTPFQRRAVGVTNKLTMVRVSGKWVRRKM